MRQKSRPPSTPLNRRAFTKRVMGGLCALPLLGLGAASPLDERIVVIGAGIAGLSAAKSLREKGYQHITVLEARQRAGGRIHSIPFAGGALDAGASWIHGTKGNPLAELAQRLDLQSTRTRYDSGELYLAPGDAVSSEEWETVERLLNQGYKQARKSPETSVGDLLESFRSQRDLSPRVLKMFNAAVRSEIELPYAADAKDLSTRALEVEDEMPGAQVTFPQGMGQLTDHLAEGLDLRFGAVVSRIQRDGDTARVSYVTDAPSGSFNHCVGCHNPGLERKLPEPESELIADRVVVAVPASVLRGGNIAFTPALPAAKQEALRFVSMGTMNKVMLEFENRFWPKGAAFLQYAGDDLSNRIEFFNPTPNGDRPMLIAITCGAHARQMENITDEAAKAEVMAALRGMFGEDATEPIHMHRTRWHTDSYALGSYPHLTTGGRLSHMDALAAPVDDRIFFAGDATHAPYIGTAHGAYLSGVRAAREIAERR